MPIPSVYVPLSAVFPEQRDDFALFCSVVQTLSRTDTIFWCARLGLILSNPQNNNEHAKQQYCVLRFLDTQEIERLNIFMKEHRDARVFFREQLVELIRWTALLAVDHPNDGNTYSDPETRRRFAQAALMASNVWGRRVYRNGLPVTGDRIMDRRRSMPALREGVTMTAPDVMRVLVRGDAFYRGAFQSGYADTDADFLAATGLTLEEYMACLRTITIHFGSVSPESENWGCVVIDRVRREIPVDMQVPLDHYIRLESQTGDELQAGLWGGRQPVDVSETELFDTRPLRERPLLRTADGRAIILDQVFYAEKAAVGPLFTLVKALDASGRGKQINLVFEAFGKAFEGYINELLRSMYPSSSILPSRLTCNLHAITANGDDVEIADACLNDVLELVLFESKGVFVPDDATRDADTYLVALRKKYGESGGRKRGAAQLGRWLKDIAIGAVKPRGQDWTQVEIIYPVLVVYDVLIDRPGHAEFLVEEFAKALEPDDVLASDYMQKGHFRVAPLIVMTIADLELLESSVNNFRLTDLLRDYVQSGHGGIRESLHDYLAFTNGKYKLSMSKLATRAEALLLETRQRMFPHIPLPETVRTS